MKKTLFASKHASAIKYVPDEKVTGNGSRVTAYLGEVDL